MEGHSDGGAVGDGTGLGPHQTGLSGTEGARRLGRDHVLGVFQTDPEEDVTVACPSAVPTRGAEGVDLQLEHPRRRHLHKQVCLHP